MWYIIQKLIQMNQSKIITLYDMSTRELLKALRSVPYERYDRYEDDEIEKIRVGSRILPGGEQVSVWATRSEIKGALVGREHVPSKKEGKLLRQLKAKTGMTEAQLRAHPKFGQELVDVQLSQPRRIISKEEAIWYRQVFGSFFATRFKVKD
jgi:hypothetical protein